MAIPYDQVALEALPLDKRYTDPLVMVFIFEELDLGIPERDRFVNDGLSSVNAMVDQYGYDVKSLQTYLQNLNKTFATAHTVADRVYFSPPNIMKLSGALFYFNHCINTLHSVPDVMEASEDHLMENY